MSKKGKSERVPPKLFRLCTKRIMFTFPRCDVDPKEVVRRAVRELPFMKWMVVSREKHDDEGLHLHGVIMFNRVYQTRRSDCLDFLTGKHGSYTKIKGQIGNVVKYVIKDGDFVEHNVEAKTIIEAMNTKVSYGWLCLYRDIKDGKTLDQLLDDERSGPMCFMNQRRAKWGVAYWGKRRLATRRGSWKKINVERLEGHSKVIALWCNSNIKKERSFKQPQLYISGPPGKGKTHLIQCLRKYLSVYEYPVKRFFNLWTDDTYDLAMIDEYKGKRDAADLNQFLQGSPCFLDQKHAGIMKHQNVPMIILSNYTLEDLFLKGRLDNMELLALKCRLLVVQIKEDEPRIDLWPVVSHKKLGFIEDQLIEPIKKRKKCFTDLSVLDFDFPGSL